MSKFLTRLTEALLIGFFGLLLVAIGRIVFLFRANN